MTPHRFERIAGEWHGAPLHQCARCGLEVVAANESVDPNAPGVLDGPWKRALSCDEQIAQSVLTS